jgi:hypothetical protein
MTAIQPSKKPAGSPDHVAADLDRAAGWILDPQE